MTQQSLHRDNFSEPDVPAPRPASGDNLEFRIGILGALIAPAIFLAGVIAYFAVFEVFDLNALSASGLVGLLIAALFAKSYSRFWDCVLAGVTSRNSGTLLLILLTVSLIAAMLTESNVSGGFVWLAGELGVGGGVFVVATFVIVCVISMSTGSSLGTMFTAFPIFYPAGVLLGAHPLLLAGALVSGAIFGDNLAPISDSTIVSASSQRYRRRSGAAEIGGVVRSRARYALVAAAISGILFLVFGLLLANDGAASVDAAKGDPLGLVMVAPVLVLLAVAFWKRDIFLAATLGLLTGIATGLVTGLINPADIISAKDGAAGGFLITGIGGMLPLVGVAIVIFGIVGVMSGAGVFDLIVDLAGGSDKATSPVRSELIIGMGSAVTGVLFAGANSVSMLLYGPVADRIGAQSQLHPYRRANVMDCFALGIGAIVPPASLFLLIASQLTQGYGEDVVELSAVPIFLTAFYPLALTGVILVAVLTGWGRRFEGEGGVELREAPAVGSSDSSLEGANDPA